MGQQMKCIRKTLGRSILKPDDIVQIEYKVAINATVSQYWDCHRYSNSSLSGWLERSRCSEPSVDPG